VPIGLAPGAAGLLIFERELGWDIAGPGAPGERIGVEGMVLDGIGAPIKDVNRWIVARGINLGLNTHMSFGDENNSDDPVTNRIEQVQRRKTLLVRKIAPSHYSVRHPSAGRGRNRAHGYLTNRR
jgi:protocatechuate 3,4-dioxygenase beta subunit